MSTEIAISAKHFATGQTVIRFDVGVRQQMGLQIGALIEAALADGTFVRGLLHVENFVDGQCARLTETLAAFEAFERFFF